jgi:O-antigen/teichoic acid export membrane protein
MYTIQMAQTLSDKADPFIIASFLGPMGVALYQPAAKVALAFSPMVMTLTGQLYPVTTKFHTTGNKISMERVLCEGTKYTLLMGCLFSAGIFIFAEPFARLWLYDSLGSDYMVVVRLMKMYAIIELLSYSSGTQWPVLLGMKRLLFLTYLLLSTAVLNITLSIYFVGYTSVGVIGVLFGTFISKVIRLLILNWHIVKLMRFNAFEYILRTFVRPAVCLLLTAIMGFALKGKFPCHTWTILILMVGLTIAVWALSCLAFGFSKSEFVELRNVIKGWAWKGKK